MIPIMWDYGTPYFSWPFLASDGGYPFKKVEGGYDVKDSGVNVPGAVKGLQEIVGPSQLGHHAEGHHLQRDGAENVQRGAGDDG